MKCLIIGGGGPVGVGLLYFLKQLNWTATVVDTHQPPHHAHHQQQLQGTLLEWIPKHYALPDLAAHLQRESFDCVIDLAPTFDKRASIAICDGLNVSLINSTMVDYKDDIHIAAYNFLDNRPTASKKPHIVASGMNPGVVNAMAEDIVRAHDAPDSIVVWEYDNSAPHDGVFKNSMTTWCLGESHDEITCDWNFEVIEEGTVLLHEDALDCPAEDYRQCGVPLDALPIPPEADAFLVGHEECIYMGWRHDTASKFVYGLHPENMKWIRRNSYDGKPTLLVGAPDQPIAGRDIVGVSCRYDEEGLWRGQYCLLENSTATPPDTNATCLLVAAGIAASALVLVQHPPKPGVYLTHEVEGFMAAFRTLIPVHDCTVTDSPISEPAGRPNQSRANQTR